MTAKGGRHGHERLRPRNAGERTAGPRPRGRGASRPRGLPHPARSAARAPGRRAGRSRPAAARPAHAPAGDVMIREASEADNPQIAAIWNLEAIGTTATTDTEPRGAEAQRAWLAAHDAAYPALVAAVGEEIVAFGGLAPYRPRRSYARTAEDSVYVKDGWRGKGVGGLILDALIERARCCGHHSMIARVIADNQASLRLHERRGFLRVGHERQVAFKLGRWLDVLTLQRMF